MQEDTSLVKQTLEGDGQAFHRLIMKYYSAIYALIMSWVKNTEDVKDLTQETFLKAYQELASLKHPEQFRVWLQQIARHQCQNWSRKKQELFVPLDDDMICETPSADEVLILRETLAKVMKAIDELPEMESQLLKDRYLDDVPYDDLEAKHGLSQSALAMRLLRAKQHVREKIKLLSGVFALSWQDVPRKIFVGGVEAVKIGIKTKILTIGIASVLVLGGTGVVVWHYQNTQEESVTNINQTDQQINKVSLAKNTSVNKLLPAKKPIDKPKEDVKDDKANEQTALQKEEINQERATLYDAKKESGKNTEDASPSSNLPPIQKQKLQEIEDTITKYVAEYHEVIETIKITDGITKPSEIHLLWDRMDSIVENVGSLASDYNAIVPGSLFDPNSKIRQLTKGVLEVGNVVIYDSSNSQDKGN